jgi:hypothetical protein
MNFIQVEERGWQTVPTLLYRSKIDVWLYAVEGDRSHVYSEAETDFDETVEGRNRKSAFLQRILSNEYVLQMCRLSSGVYTNGDQPNADAFQLLCNCALWRCVHVKDFVHFLSRSSASLH